MIIFSINGVEYQVNITPTLNLTVNNTKYPKVVRGDFFVNGQVLDQDGALISNVTSGQIITVNTGESLTELWEASSQAEKISLYIALSNEDLIALYLALSDAQRLVMQGGLSIGQLFTLYDGLSDAQRITLFQTLSAQNQIDIYNGLTDVLRKSLFDQLTATQKDYIIPLYPNYTIPSGQLTAFATNDDRWQEVNVLAPLRALVPKYSRKVNLTNFYTLSDNNIHGNTLRFTLENGTEPALGTGGQLIQDHFTGYDFITGGSNSGTARNFADTLTYVNALTFGGYSNYYWAGWKILCAYYDDNNTGGFINKYDNQSFLVSSTSLSATKHRGIRAVDSTDAINSSSYHRIKTATTTVALIYRIR